MTDHFDYSRIKNYKLYTFAVPIAKFIMSLKYKLRYEGKENLPKTGAYIVSANHLTSFDPVLLAMNSGRVIHFMAKYETFEKPFRRFFLTHFNSFPVKRGSSDKSSIEYAIRLIKNGEGDTEYKYLIDENKCVHCFECINHYTGGCYMRRVLLPRGKGYSDDK